jgi:hypothetical protein
MELRADEVDYYGLHSHCLLLAVAGTHKRLELAAAGPHSLLGCRVGSEVGLRSGLIDWGVE